MNLQKYLNIFLKNATNDMKNLWKVLEANDIVIFGGFWRHKCSIEYLYGGQGDLDLIGKISLRMFKIYLYNNIKGLSIKIQKSNNYFGTANHSKLLLTFADQKSINIDYLQEDDFKIHLSDYYCNSLSYNISERSFYLLPLYSGAENSMEKCLEDISNKKLNSGGDWDYYCKRDFFRIIKMYQRGFKIDSNNFDTMNHVQNILQIGIFWLEEIDKNTEKSFVKIFFPLIKKMNTLEISPYLIEVLYKYAKDEFINFIKLKTPLIEDIAGLASLTEIYPHLLKDIHFAKILFRYIELYPEEVILECYTGRDNFTIFTFENIRKEQLKHYLINYEIKLILAFNKRFDLLDNILDDNIDNCYYGSIGMYPKWIIKNDQRFLIDMFCSSVKKGALLCFKKMGASANKDNLILSLRYGKMDIFNYIIECFKSANPNNYLDNISKTIKDICVGSWATPKELKILAHYGKKITTEDIHEAVYFNRNTLKYMLKNCSYEIGLESSGLVYQIYPQDLIYYTIPINTILNNLDSLLDNKTLLKNMEEKYNRDILLSKKLSDSFIFEKIRSYWWN